VIASGRRILPTHIVREVSRMRPKSESIASLLSHGNTFENDRRAFGGRMLVILCHARTVIEGLAYLWITSNDPCRY